MSVLPSFPSVRERNLRTLYGGGGGRDDDGIDKSPKGSVDTKIRPLVDLINRHPDYVTLSSCSGRVALFDPTAGISSITETANDGNNNNDCAPRSSTNNHGKGHGGKWIFVTHDLLPDLGLQIIQSLKQVGRERLGQYYHQTSSRSMMVASSSSSSSSPSSLVWLLSITFKHEPPLLHVAASNLESGMRLLRIIKSAPQCAMRESGLVVTDKRVTVELRTTSTMVSLPIMVGLSLQWWTCCEDRMSVEDCDIVLAPNEEYLLTLADIVNKHMLHNESILDGIFSIVQKELFGVADIPKMIDDDDDDNYETISSSHYLEMIENVSDDTRTKGETKDDDNDNYTLKIQSSLPSLNLWKTAVVVLQCNTSFDCIERNEEIDLDVIAFGGQGVGPNNVLQENNHPIECINNDDGHIDEISSHQASTACKRWNSVFRLKRRNTVWSEHWEILPSFHENNDSLSDFGETAPISFRTVAGLLSMTVSKEGMGNREGHAAVAIPHCAKPIHLEEGDPPSDAILVFGGRTSGRGQGMTPTNDLFIYLITDSSHNSLLDKTSTCKQKMLRANSTYGLFGRPCDVRGTPPDPRYGHTMNLIPHQGNLWRDVIPWVVVTGGTGTFHGLNGVSNSVCLHSMHTLSCVYEWNRNNESYPTCSHLMWNRIADLPVPRSFHTSVCIDDQRMFIFGGIAEADDPFSLPGSTPSFCTVPLDLGNTTPTVTSECSETDIPSLASLCDDNDNMPLRIGSSAALIALETSAVVVVVGGSRTTSTVSNSSHWSNREDGNSPILLFASKIEERSGKEDHSSRSKEALVRTRFRFESESDESMDLGSCVHHCVIALPRMMNDSDDSASFMIIGGGVPCFSFGQSYARSCIIHIQRRKNDRSSSASQTRLNSSRPQHPIIASSSCSDYTGITQRNDLEDFHSTRSRNCLPSSPEESSQHPDSSNNNSNNNTPFQRIRRPIENSIVPVLYVDSIHAKMVKNVLEKNGILDKRYKLFPIMPDKKEIAIPVRRLKEEDGVRTTSLVSSYYNHCCCDNDDDDSSSSPSSLFQPSWIKRYGTETMVPYSSSFYGKMKNSKHRHG